MDYRDDIEYLFQGSGDLLRALDQQLDNFEDFNSINVLTLFGNSSLVGLFIRACQLTEQECSDVNLSNLDIANYLALMSVNNDFPAVTDRFIYFLGRIRKHQEEMDCDNLDQYEDYLRSHFPSEADSSVLNATIRMGNLLKKEKVDLVSNIIHLAERLRMEVLHKMDYIEEALMTDEGLNEFILQEFCRFATDVEYDYKRKLRNSVLKLKTNRLEALSRIHWARLADLDDELVKKVINGEKFDNDAYSDLYDDSDLAELKRNKEILSELREIASPEGLFDWNALFERHYSMHPFLNGDNVYFFFARVHRENLIKCELYDGLAEQYHQFLYGPDLTDTSAGPMPPSPAQAEDKAEKASDGIINRQIDEAKLIAFIRNYVDGPHKSNYFDKKSYWLSIYVVLRQPQKQLGGLPIFLPASRPKFVQWVNANVCPFSVPCVQGPIDTAPPYFRSEKNYPWDIHDFYKAGGTQEKTFNGYSMVADYFQTNLIDRLDDFIVPLVP